LTRVGRCSRDENQERFPFPHTCYHISENSPSIRNEKTPCPQSFDQLPGQGLPVATPGRMPEINTYLSEIEPVVDIDHYPPVIVKCDFLLYRRIGALDYLTLENLSSEDEIIEHTHLPLGRVKTFLRTAGDIETDRGVVGCARWKLHVKNIIPRVYTSAPLTSTQTSYTCTESVRFVSLTSQHTVSHGEPSVGVWKKFEKNCM